MAESVSQALSEMEHNLRAHYGARLAHLVLFGSHARGEAGPASDIDLLVVLQDDVRQGREICDTGAFVADVSLRYDAVVSCFFMTERQYATADSPLLRNIRREGVPLL